VRAEQDCPATISDAPVTDTRGGAPDAMVEPRRLIPELRATVGDDRRVIAVGV
jgi:hypothetical protein